MKLRIGGRKKDAMQPPMRSRAQSPTASSRPAFSYYTSGQRPVDRPSEQRQVAAPQKAQKSTQRGWSQRLITWGCLAVVAVCAVKLLTLVPHSKVVVTENAASIQLDSSQYARSADELLESSPLNRVKLTMNVNGISHALQQKYPDLSSVVVAAPLIGNRPVVYVAVARPAFRIETTTGVYTLSDNGFILARLSDDSANLPRLVEASGRQPEVGKQYLPASTVRFATTLVYELQNGKVAVDHLDLPSSSAYELDVFLSGKTYHMRFNLQEDAMQQSGAVLAVLQQLGSRSPAEYIDLRVPGRAYYK